MKKITCSLLVCLITASLGFAQSNTAAVKPNYTAKDAAIAYNAFNKYFYDSTNKLYFGTTKKEGVAAIWTQAIYWDLAMDVYERTHNKAQLKLIADIYQGNYIHYDAYNWTNTKVWFIYDDMMWWIMSLARAHQLTGNEVYLQKAVEGFNHVWQGSYDKADGGMFWDFKHSGKNACINYPTAIAAMRLYKITGDTAYLNKAKAVYAWARANLFDTVKGRVADHKIGNNRAGYEDYTYNQGVAIGAAVMLYQQTKDATYLNDARLAADYTQNTMCKNGILPAEGDFNEQGVLKTIFVQYLTRLIKDAGQTQYISWMQTNANTGWQNRDTSRQLTYRNYNISCPTGDIQSYEGSSIVTLMQLFPVKK